MCSVKQNNFLLFPATLSWKGRSRVSEREIAAEIQIRVTDPELSTRLRSRFRAERGKLTERGGGGGAGPHLRHLTEIARLNLKILPEKSPNTILGNSAFRIFVYCMYA